MLGLRTVTTYPTLEHHSRIPLVDYSLIHCTILTDAERKVDHEINMDDLSPGAKIDPPYEITVRRHERKVLTEGAHSG